MMRSQIKPPEILAVGPTERADPHNGCAKVPGRDAENHQIASRKLGWFIVSLSAVSVTVYFGFSNGIRNHIAFLVDTAEKAGRILGFLP